RRIVFGRRQLCRIGQRRQRAPQTVAEAALGADRRPTDKTRSPAPERPAAHRREAQVKAV
ncbi:hypothetical protein IWQ57_005038, partial [Coemansia nantahalensis]